MTEETTAPDEMTQLSDTQRAVVTLMQDPASYSAAVEAVTRHDTHASMVFLAGDFAYKVKRALTYPYLDFGTLAKRRRACVAELRLNRRTAPDLYLGIVPIQWRADGSLHLGETISAVPDDGDLAAREASGEVAEYAVKMRRFDNDALLSAVSARSGLAPTTVDALADSVARFHDTAAVVRRDPVRTHRDEIADNLADLRASPELFDPEMVDRLEAGSYAALQHHAERLAGRARDGFVRRCHGDLHLRNIVLLDGRPTLFDCIEFNDALAEIDVIYDLAFLLMDLDQRGQRVAANRLLTRYMNRRDDIGGLAALPLYLSLRAAIRAKVGASALAANAGSSSQAGQVRACRDYFAAACAYLDAPGPRLIAVGGVSGTGKTTIARGVAPEIGAAPGALVVRSDVERKRLFDVAETERLPESAYQGRINAEVYDRIHERARQALTVGRSVVLEATFLRREDRAQARKLAETVGVPFTGLWLTAPAETLKARVDARRQDASDATAEIVAAQLDRAPKGETAWPTVDASGGVGDVTAAAKAVLAVHGHIAQEEG